MGAIISLTYDDATGSHLEVAAPSLERRGFKGTFFVADRLGTLRKEPGPWRALCRVGHELAAHTLYHPCPQAARWNPPGIEMDQYDEARMEADLKANIALLRDLGEARQELSFAYPCGCTWLGPDKRSYISMIKKFFCAARSCREGYEDPRQPDFYESRCINATGLSAVQLIGAAKQAVAGGFWAVYMFHGIGADDLRVERKDHDEFLDFLSSRSDEVLVEPYGNAALRLRAG
jgi:sialate O-acetylesterase